MIRFPKLSIAESAVNRIFNAHADAKARQKIAAQAEADENGDPTPPDPSAQGAQIDAQLSAPVQPVASDDPAVEDAVTLKGLDL